MTVALSTGFAHAARLGPPAIVDALLRAGAAGAVLDAAIDPALFDPLRRELAARRSELPIVAVESPCPRGPWSRAMLASLERAEADVALAAAETTVREAGEAGARFVVVRLGELRELGRDWLFARDRFLTGRLDETLGHDLGEARDDVAFRALDVARRVLERLGRAAESAGVVVCVRNGRRYTEVPTARELDFLLADCAGAPLAPLCDFAAAHLTDVMGFQSLALTMAAFGARAPLVYAGDACGPVGALAPGRGVLDVAALLKLVPAEAALAFSPWSGLTIDEAIEAPAIVAEVMAAVAAAAIPRR